MKQIKIVYTTSIPPLPCLWEVNKLLLLLNAGNFTVINRFPLQLTYKHALSISCILLPTYMKNPEHCRGYIFN